MNLISTYTIDPVLELEPSPAQKTVHKRPRTETPQSDAERNAQWLQSLAELGIIGIQSIAPGTKLVQLEKIDDLQLHPILTKELKDTDLNDLENIPPLSGGLAISSENDLLLAPQCCAAIYDAIEWNHLIQLNNPQWHRIWIGHPWIYGRLRDSLVEITGYTEENTSRLTNNHVKYAFDKITFTAKLDQALTEIQSFKHRLTNVLQSLPVSQPDVLARVMVDGHSEF